MKNTFGNNITVTLFGESHGPAIGCVIDGLPSGFQIDEAQLRHDMERKHVEGVALELTGAEAERAERLGKQNK